MSVARRRFLRDASCRPEPLKTGGRGHGADSVKKLNEWQVNIHFKSSSPTTRSITPFYKSYTENKIYCD